MPGRVGSRCSWHGNDSVFPVPLPPPALQMFQYPRTVNPHELSLWESIRKGIFCQKLRLPPILPGLNTLSCRHLSGRRKQGFCLCHPLSGFRRPLKCSGLPGFQLPVHLSGFRYQCRKGCRFCAAVFRSGCLPGSFCCVLPLFHTRFTRFRWLGGYLGFRFIPKIFRFLRLFRWFLRFFRNVFFLIQCQQFLLRQGCSGSITPGQKGLPFQHQCAHRNKGAPALFRKPTFPFSGKEYRFPLAAPPPAKLSLSFFQADMARRPALFFPQHDIHMLHLLHSLCAAKRTYACPKRKPAGA